MIGRVLDEGGSWTGIEIRDDEDEDEDDMGPTRVSLMFPGPVDDEGGTAPYLLVTVGEDYDDAGPDERAIILSIVDLEELHAALGAWLKKAKHS